MVTITYYAELAIASAGVILILLCIFKCIEIISKSSGKLKNAMIFLLIAFIPSIIYTVGRILNIEAIFKNGKFLSLTLNALTMFFILLGIIYINRLIKEIIDEVPSKKEADKESYEKEIVAWCKNAIKKGYNESQIKDFLISNNYSPEKINEIVGIYKKVQKR